MTNHTSVLRMGGTSTPSTCGGRRPASKIVPHHREFREEVHRVTGRGTTLKRRRRWRWRGSGDNPGVTYRHALAKGIRRGEASWILETNLPMRRALEKMGFTISKTCRLYDQALQARPASRSRLTRTA